MKGPNVSVPDNIDYLLLCSTKKNEPLMLSYYAGQGSTGYWLGTEDQPLRTKIQLGNDSSEWFVEYSEHAGIIFLHKKNGSLHFFDENGLIKATVQTAFIDIVCFKIHPDISKNWLLVSLKNGCIFRYDFETQRSKGCVKADFIAKAAGVAATHQPLKIKIHREKPYNIVLYNQYMLALGDSSCSFFPKKCKAVDGINKIYLCLKFRFPFLAVTDAGKFIWLDQSFTVQDRFDYFSSLKGEVLKVTSYAVPGNKINIVVATQHTLYFFDSNANDLCLPIPLPSDFKNIFHLEHSAVIFVQCHQGETLKVHKTRLVPLAKQTPLSFKYTEDDLCMSQEGFIDRVIKNIKHYTDFNETYGEKNTIRDVYREYIASAHVFTASNNAKWKELSKALDQSSDSDAHLWRAMMHMQKHGEQAHFLWLTYLTSKLSLDEVVDYKIHSGVEILVQDGPNCASYMIKMILNHFNIDAPHARKRDKLGARKSIRQQFKEDYPNEDSSRKFIGGVNDSHIVESLEKYGVKVEPITIPLENLQALNTIILQQLKAGALISFSYLVDSIPRDASKPVMKSDMSKINPFSQHIALIIGVIELKNNHVHIIVVNPHGHYEIWHTSYLLNSWQVSIQNQSSLTPFPESSFVKNRFEGRWKETTAWDPRGFKPWKNVPKYKLPENCLFCCKG